MYAIYTSQQLSADPTYDSEANKSGWEKIVKFLFGFKMDNTAKSVTGLVAALLAIALLAGPVGWSISAAVLVVTGSMIATSLMSAGIGALNAAVSGGDVVKGLNDGLADGLFWSGLSAFISAGISAIQSALASSTALMGRTWDSSHVWAKESAWPPNNGFLGDPVEEILRPGTLVDRYGDMQGKFVSPQGTPFEARSLPSYFKYIKSYHIYRVEKPISVLSGEIAPWFGMPGGGIQYYLPEIIEFLIKKGILVQIK